MSGDACALTHEPLLLGPALLLPHKQVSRRRAPDEIKKQTNSCRCLASAPAPRRARSVRPRRRRVRARSGKDKGGLLPSGAAAAPLDATSTTVPFPRPVRRRQAARQNGLIGIAGARLLPVGGGRPILLEVGAAIGGTCHTPIGRQMVGRIKTGILLHWRPRKQADAVADRLTGVSGDCIGRLHRGA